MSPSAQRVISIRIDMVRPQQPETLSLLMMASQLDPSLGMCALAKGAFDEAGASGAIDDLVQIGGGGGWWKGAAQMMQSFVLGVGGYDTCQ